MNYYQQGYVLVQPCPGRHSVIPARLNVLSSIKHVPAVQCSLVGNNWGCYGLTTQSSSGPSDASRSRAPGDRPTVGCWASHTQQVCCSPDPRRELRLQLGVPWWGTLVSVMCVDESFATPVRSPGQRINDDNKNAFIDTEVVELNIVDDTT